MQLPNRIYSVRQLRSEHVQYMKKLDAHLTLVRFTIDICSRQKINFSDSRWSKQPQLDPSISRPTSFVKEAINLRGFSNMSSQTLRKLSFV